MKNVLFIQSTIMYGYIYLTTNLVNGRKYWGKRQYGKKEPYLGSGKLLKQAIKKYGKENFSKQIICDCETKEQLNNKEKHFIALTNAVYSKEYYNISYGGDGGKYGSISEETRKKLSIACTGKKNGFYNKTHSEETKKHLSEIRKNQSSWNKGIPISDEQHQKLLKGRKEYFKKNPHPFLNKHLTEEHKQKISKARKGKYCGENHPMYGVHKYGSDSPAYGHKVSEETKEKISKSNCKYIRTILTPNGNIETTNNLYQYNKKHKIRLGPNRKKSKGYILLSEELIKKD